jgi:uncharacterized integral membrane protein
MVHRGAIGWAFGLALLLTVILQNVEPTRIDILFWSLPAVPKLALIVGSMLVGAALWETARRLTRLRSRPRTPSATGPPE